MKKDFYDIALDNYIKSKYSMALFAAHEYLTHEPKNKAGKFLLNKARKYCERSIKIDPKYTSAKHCLQDILQAIASLRKRKLNIKL